ncbi:MAG: hypothetical protein ABWY16_09195 [Pedobacter sp.]|uniref:hypothetical protein n=1 Tax=Pedobacter sp. TaxID=1411316 RepID=UPI0033928096
MRKPVKLLKDWVALKHKGQLIRESGEPYFNHVAAVAAMASGATDFGYEIGLCHDLLEDTYATINELRDALLSFGYSQSAAMLISSCVLELTDVFTKSAYPGLGKSARKKMEAARLLTISPAAQTVKYADLIYNIGWVLKYDKKRAKKYLLKKKRLLNALIEGDKDLHSKALSAVLSGLQSL